MNGMIVMRRMKNIMFSLFFILTCLSINAAYACHDDECSTEVCGCQKHQCPTCAGSFCTGNNINCDLKGQCGFSCALWCTTSDTCSNTGGQLGSSECCVTDVRTISSPPAPVVPSTPSAPAGKAVKSH